MSYTMHKEQTDCISSMDFLSRGSYDKIRAEIEGLSFYPQYTSQ